jgi:predicted aldo/keto reductase-like oxidoreductase
MVAVIRTALSRGINHFETARFYGTSEIQFSEALGSMLESGEVKREDIIVQTKCTPSSTNEDFRKTWDKSWKLMQRIG